MKRILVFLAALMLLGATPVSAQSTVSGTPYKIAQRSDVVPLRDVIRRIQREYGGQYLDAELKRRSNGRAEYHIDWQKNGRKFVFIVDAKSGRIIRSTGG